MPVKVTGGVITDKETLRITDWASSIQQLPTPSRAQGGAPKGRISVLRILASFDGYPAPSVASQEELLNTAGRLLQSCSGGILTLKPTIVGPVSLGAITPGPQCPSYSTSNEWMETAKRLVRQQYNVEPDSFVLLSVLWPFDAPECFEGDTVFGCVDTGIECSGQSFLRGNTVSGLMHMVRVVGVVLSASSLYAHSLATTWR